MKATDLCEIWLAVQLSSFVDETLEERDWNCFVLGWEGVESQRFLDAPSEDDPKSWKLDYSTLRAWNFASGFCSGVVLFWCCRVNGGLEGVALELVVDDQTLGGFALGRSWRGVPPPADVYLRPCIAVSFTAIADARRRHLPLAQRLLGGQIANWLQALSRKSENK